MRKKKDIMENGMAQDGINEQDARGYVINPSAREEMIGITGAQQRGFRILILDILDLYLSEGYNSQLMK